MTIIFTEEEEKYIVKEPFNWHIAKDCPEQIKESLAKKLSMLKARKGG